MKKNRFVIYLLVATIFALVGFGFGFWQIVQYNKVSGTVKSFNIIDLNDTSSVPIESFYYNDNGFEGSDQYSISITAVFTFKSKANPYNAVISLVAENDFLASASITPTTTLGSVSGNNIIIDNISSEISVTVTYQITTTSSNWNTLKSGLDGNKKIEFNVSARSDNGIWNITKKFNVSYLKRDITITWKNWDGSILQTDTNVAYGSMPTYNGPTPTRANDTQERYQFSGWDKEVLPATQSETYTAKLDVICAYFAADPTRTFTTIESALAAATSGTIVIVEPCVDANSVSNPTKVEYHITSDCEVKSGVTLVIPTSKQLITSVNSSSTLTTYITDLYQDSGNRNTTNGFATSTTGYATTNTKYLRVTLTIDDGVTLTNNGTIVVSGYLTSNSGAGVTGQTANSYSQIKLGANANIFQNNSSAVIHCYGYIIESSQDNNSNVTISNGTLYVPFLINDYRGFSFEWALTYNSNEALNSKRASAFNQFEIRNIYSIATINYNGKVIGRGNFYVTYSTLNVDEHFYQDINLVGNTSGYMIQFTNSTSCLISKYDFGTSCALIKLYGSMKLNSLSVSLSRSGVTVNLSTGNSFFPLSYHQKVELYSVSGTATFDLSSQRLKVLPGSSLTVGNNCTLNGSEIIVYSAFLDGSRGNGYSSSCGYSSVSYPQADGGILKVNSGGILSATSLAGTVYGESSSITSTNTSLTSYEPWSIGSSGTYSPAWKITDYLLIKESLDIHSLNDLNKYKVYVGFNTFNNYSSYTPSVTVVANGTNNSCDTYQKVLHFDSLSSYTINLVRNVYLGYKNTARFIKGETISYPTYRNVYFINSVESISSNNNGVNEFNVQSISITCSTPLVNGEVPSYIDTSIQLVANVVDIDKAYVEMNNSLKKLVSWASSNTSIATVDSNGLVTGHTLGTCVITATCDGKSATYSITVKEEPQLEAIESITITDNKGNSSEKVAGNDSNAGGDYHGAYGNDVNITFSVNVIPSTAPYASIKWTFKASAAGRQYVNDNTQTIEVIENVTQVVVHTVSGTGASADGASLTCEVTDLSGNKFTKVFKICHKADACLEENMQITLFDGSTKAIKDLTYNDKVLSWDFVTGKFVESDIILLINHGISLNKVLHLYFEDDYCVKFIGTHGLFDMTTMKFEYLNIANVDNYINHEFAIDNTHKVKLLGYTIEEKETGAYSIYASHSGDVIANGMITMTPPIEEGAEFFGFFDVLDNLTFDMEQIEKDIETYGLYDYSVFEPYITYEQFDKLNGKYLKIAVEKGIITWNQILRLIDFISPYFE